MEENTTPSTINSINAKNGKKLIIIVMIFTLLVCFLITLAGVAGYLIYNSSKSPVLNDSNTNQQNNNANNEEENGEEDINNEVEEEALTKQFNGDYVQATIPTDWKIVEHKGSEGMYDFFDSGSITFTGLTGLDIIDENDNVVFQLQGVEGIGGAGGCAEVAKFDDTEASYIQMVEEERVMVGLEPTVILDLTSVEYVQISTLDKSMRRVGPELYMATEGSASVFNTACGISAKFLTTGEVSFTINDGENEYEISTYSYGILEGITSSATLEKLDTVLNSLKKAE